jgi:ADP-heptose:LPS heptosyltransferase
MCGWFWFRVRKIGVGDELMASGRARVMQLTDPRKVRVLHNGQVRWNEVWDLNPRIARPEEKGNFQVLEARGKDNLRPYHTNKTDKKWTYNLSFRADRGEIYFSQAELDFGEKHKGLVIIEPNIKLKASPNKQWGWERWQKLADLMRAEGITPTQFLGAPGAKQLNGVAVVQSPGFRYACAVIAKAKACVLPEGGLHHAAAAVNTPAVVIFGGFTPVELTGYEGHKNLGVSLGDACGLRQPCDHCSKEMAKITPEQVLRELKKFL